MKALFDWKKKTKPILIYSSYHCDQKNHCVKYGKNRKITKAKQNYNIFSQKLSKNEILTSEDKKSV
jgi:hypothetical protein